MEPRRLGDSDLEVSPIALGSWLTYSGGVRREQTAACTRAAIEHGITFFDTANVYGRGAAERAWGEILGAYPRESYVLATKAYFSMGRGDKGLSREQVHKQLDASLKRLRTDYVDLFQCHRYDDDVPLEETMGALAEAVAAGKARHVGFSEWTPEQIESALAIGEPRFVSSQPQYSLLWRRPEAEVFPLCRSGGIGQVVWSPLAQGVLTGKYRPGEPPPVDSRWRHLQMGKYMGAYMQRDVLERVARLRPVADEAGLTMSQLALAWVLRDPSTVSAALIGASRPAQIAENVRAAQVTLSADTLAAIDAALEA